MDSNLERPNIGKRCRRFSYDFEGKNYDIVPNIVPDIVLDIVSDIVYIYLTCHLTHAGPSLRLQRPEISDSDDDVDSQMDDHNLRDYDDQFL